MRLLRSAASPAYLLLVLVVVAGLLLRVVNNDYGLPYVYSYDEETHFVSRAVEMFGGTFNPGYFQNPSAFTYLVHATLRLMFGQVLPTGALFELPLQTVSQQFIIDPTPIWVIGRSLAALCAMLGVVATFFVGKRLWGTHEGLVAAAVLSFAFLPVAYSRIAVTDVGTFLPAVLAVYGAVKVYEDGGRRHYLLAGAATGLAIGFKYTAGLVLLPLLAAAALRIGRESGVGEGGGLPRAAAGRPSGAGRALGLLRGLHRREEGRNTALALAAAAGVFFLTTPYFFFSLRSALYQLKQQAESAGLSEKFGQAQDFGPLYYLDTLTWGLGWAGIVAALVGVALECRRNRVRAFLLVIFPVALFLYMSLQSRYFGRWLLPLYPVLALFCGVALARIAQLVRAGPMVRAAALGVIALLVLAQPVAADLHTAAVLGRKDTRNLARDFLVTHFPARLRIAIEPAIPVVPELYYQLRQAGDDALEANICTGLGKLRPASAQPVGEGDCLATNQQRFVRGFLRDLRRAVSISQGTGMVANLAVLREKTIDRYRRNGFCLVMTMSFVRDRARNARDASALAYYERLERESSLIWRASPYRPGAQPPDFHFDLSYNYYPRAFERPGPEVRIYRLKNCRQGFDNVPLRPRGMDALNKGIGTSLTGGTF